MSKAVLYSIRPKYCKLILDGKKTVEVRKSIPKLDVPFKCYIYCTYGFGLIEYKDEVLPNHLLSQKVTANKKWDNCCNGKVIGEFMCYDIGKYETEFYPKGQKQVYEAIYQYNEDEEVWEPVLTNDTEQKTQFAKDTCLSFEDFYNYLGAGENQFYGLHISDLVIYHKPKELTDFFVEGECYPPRCSKCKYFDKGNGYNVEDDCLLPYHLNEDGNDVKPLFKAPQSWCYVEEISGA